MKQNKRFILMFSVLLLLLWSQTTVALQQDGGPPRVGLFPDSPQYAMHGPYWVGTREFVIGADTERPLATTMWYPAINPNFVPEEINYTYTPLLYRPVTVPGHAIAEAFPDFSGGPYPLVIFSHDNYMTRFAALYLTEHLASQGFVVMAAQRAGTGTGDTLYFTAQDVENVANSLVYGPADIQRQIDFATALTAPDGTLSGLIDVEKSAVIGHATGADAALTAAGARISLASYQDWCNSVADDPEITSGFDYYYNCVVYVGSEQRLLDMLGATTQPGELWPEFDVKGVDAVISLSTWNNLYEKGDLTGVTAPTLVIFGDMFPIDVQVNQTVYEKIASQQKAQIVFEHGAEALTEEPCDSLQEQNGYFICYQEPIWDLNRSHDRVRHFATAFLLDTLKGDQDAHAALLAENVSFPGISYKTTMN